MIGRGGRLGDWGSDLRMLGLDYCYYYCLGKSWDPNWRR